MGEKQDDIVTHFQRETVQMRGWLWIKASRNMLKKLENLYDYALNVPPQPYPLLPLPFLIWPVKAFSLLLRDAPHCTRTPMPASRQKMKAAIWILSWARNTWVERKCTDRTVNQILNPLPTQPSEGTKHVSFTCKRAWSCSNKSSSKNTNRKWKHSKATKCANPSATLFAEGTKNKTLRFDERIQIKSKMK